LSGLYCILTRKKIFYLFAVFLLGFIVGSTFLTIIISKEYDQLVLQNKKLISQVEEKDAEIKQLKKNLARQKENFIEKININLITDLNEHRNQQIKENLQKILENLIGKSVNDVDPIFISDMINDRYFKDENKVYQLKLKLLVLGRSLDLYIETTTEKAGSDE